MHLHCSAYTCKFGEIFVYVPKYNTTHVSTAVKSKTHLIEYKRSKFTALATSFSCCYYVIHEI